MDTVVPGREPQWSELVDVPRRRVSHRVFSDPAIHALEIERIFNRSWLYLAHESEIPAKGDYVVRTLGSDEVILVRGEDNQVRAFLNSCQHRGMPLCRVNSGHTLRFVCPYHGWTYDLAGRMRTTTFDDQYEAGHVATASLMRVPQLDSVNGLIFGNWDAEATPLATHLGGLRWYLDILFQRTPGGMCVAGPPQRWLIETNWKIPAINFLDAQHAMRAHAGPLSMAQAAGAPPLADIIKSADQTPLLTFAEGHGIVQDQFSPILPPFFGFSAPLVPLYERTLTPEQFAKLRDAAPMVGTIFPMTSWVMSRLAVGKNDPPRTMLSLRNWQPRGPDRIEVSNWFLVEREASESWREETHLIGLQTFGMGGIFEEDDAEIWATLSRTTRNPVAQRGFMDFAAGQSLLPLPPGGAPGVAYPSLLTDQAQWSYLLRWKQLMERAPMSPAARE